MSNIAYTIKKSFEVYCENNYKMNQSAFDAGFPFM